MPAASSSRPVMLTRASGRAGTPEGREPWPPQQPSLDMAVHQLGVAAAAVGAASRKGWQRRRPFLQPHSMQAARLRALCSCSSSAPLRQPTGFAAAGVHAACGWPPGPAAQPGRAPSCHRAGAPCRCLPVPRSAGRRARSSLQRQRPRPTVPCSTLHAPLHRRHHPTTTPPTRPHTCATRCAQRTAQRTAAPAARCPACLLAPSPAAASCKARAPTLRRWPKSVKPFARASHAR